MTKSKYTDVTILSPNNSGRRTQTVSKITIHHMAGNPSIELCGEWFKNPNRMASSNYGIGSDGRIACYVEEENRAWTSSSAWNDNQAITIEVANDSFEPDWTISDKAYKALVKLCADICERYNIMPIYDGTIYGSFTEHRMFWATACPGPYIHTLLANGTLIKAINNELAPKVNEVTYYVKHLYEKVLGREADARGLQYWVTQIVDRKTTLASVVKSFYMSKEYTSRGTNDKKFVEDCYRGYFNRRGNRNEVEYWLSNMRKGMSREQVLDRFGSSNEFVKVAQAFGV